ncbi:hypothetical protein N665_0408s0005 [Sinapis alba]|nr:hypothetical protein N665_0408s0005 [Sinapis alba]
MGQQQFKDELVSQQVSPNDVEGIKSLRHEGAGLECAEKEGRTPLIVACAEAELYDASVMIVNNSSRHKRQRRRGYISHARRWAQVDRPNKGDIKQLNWFSEACKGTPQPMNPPMFLKTTEKIISNDLTPSVPLPRAVTVEAEDISVHYESKERCGGSGVCVICVDASLEAACVPCGHVAGCVSCLKEIKNKKLGCPICRASIDQVIKLYHV